MAVQPLLLSPLMEQLKVFEQVTALHMIQNMFSSYRAIGKIDLEENSFKIMGPHDPSEPLASFINQLKKGRDFSRE